RIIVRAPPSFIALGVSLTSDHVKVGKQSVNALRVLASNHFEEDRDSAHGLILNVPLGYRFERAALSPPPSPNALRSLSLAGVVFNTPPQARAFTVGGVMPEGGSPPPQELRLAHFDPVIGRDFDQLAAKKQPPDSNSGDRAAFASALKGGEASG